MKHQYTTISRNHWLTARVVSWIFLSLPYFVARDQGDDSVIQGRFMVTRDVFDEKPVYWKPVVRNNAWLWRFLLENYFSREGGQRARDSLCWDASMVDQLLIRDYAKASNRFNFFKSRVNIECILATFLILFLHYISRDRYINYFSGQHTNKWYNFEFDFERYCLFRPLTYYFRDDFSN